MEHKKGHIGTYSMFYILRIGTILLYPYCQHPYPTSTSRVHSARSYFGPLLSSRLTYYCRNLIPLSLLLLFQILSSRYTNCYFIINTRYSIALQFVDKQRKCARQVDKDLFQTSASYTPCSYPFEDR